MAETRKKICKKHIILITTALLFVAGVILIIAGALSGNKNPTLWTPYSLTDAALGKEFYGKLVCQVVNVNETDDGAFCIVSFEDDSETLFVGLEVPKGEVRKFSKYLNSTGIVEIDIKGIVFKTNEEIINKMTSPISELYDFYTEIGIELIYSKEEMLEHTIAPYYVEVIPSMNGKLLIIIGSALALLGSIISLAVLFGKKFWIAFFGVCIVGVVTLVLINVSKIRTVSSVRKISDGLYYMESNYDCDEYLNANLDSTDDLINWIETELFYGIDQNFYEDNFSCAAFASSNENGHKLFGRNFDYPDTDTLVIYNEPKNGYASIGVADLKFLDIGTENGMDPNSLSAKVVMLAAPYICMDGINEKGIGVGCLMLYTPEVHQNNGKNDILITMAIRGILDKCASIDEAVELLQNYDMHSFLGCSYHLFITDRTGKSVVVEWSDDELFVVEDSACTNDILSENHIYFEPDWSCKRYDTLKQTLADKNSILTKKEAMELLSAVKDNQEGRGTVWSCVYDLNDFSLDICINKDYDRVFKFNSKGFVKDLTLNDE